MSFPKEFRSILHEMGVDERSSMDAFAKLAVQPLCYQTWYIVHHMAKEKGSDRIVTRIDFDKIVNDVDTELLQYGVYNQLPRIPIGTIGKALMIGVFRYCLKKEIPPESSSPVSTLAPVSVSVPITSPVTLSTTGVDPQILSAFGKIASDPENLWAVLCFLALHKK